MPVSAGSRRLSLTELSRVVAAPVAEDLHRVLPQPRWRKPDRAGFTVDLPRRANLVDRAGLRVLDFDAHLPRRRHGTGKGLFDVQDGARRNSKLLKTRQPVLPRVLLEVAFDRSDQLGSGRPPQGSGGKSRVRAP